MAGIYIHIPFCSQFCNYCDFYSVKRASRELPFVESLINESSERGDFFKGSSPVNNTLYFGGGTPSLLPPETLGMIARTICNNLNVGTINELTEFTVEVNPDDATESYLKSLYKEGVRRLSIGIQSFNNAHLRWMNRRHDSEQAYKAVRYAQEIGYENISIDLIFGFSHLTMDQWLDNVEEAVLLKPQHISAYQLGVERGTKLWNEYQKGEYIIPDDNYSHRQYSMLQETLAAAGYRQYEVSSFAIPGKEALHNSSYWDQTPYIGLGPAAHSFDGTYRYRNPSSLNGYIKRYRVAGGDEKYIIKERRTTKDLFNETIMLSLRRTIGFDYEQLLQLCPVKSRELFSIRVNELLDRDLVVIDGNKIKIPSDKLFISDGIIRELFI